MKRGRSKQQPASKPARKSQRNTVRTASAAHLARVRETQQALRESEVKYRTIIQTIEDGYYEVDIAGNFTFHNDSLCRILGYPPDELLGVNNRQYADAETSKQVYQAFNKVFRTGQPRQEFNWQIIRKDGTKRFVDTSIHLIRDAANKPIGFRGIVRDITERRRAEKERARLLAREQAARTEAEAAEQRFRNLVQGLDAIVLEADANTWQFTFVSRRAEDILGYPVQQWLTEPNFWTNHIHPDDRERTVNSCLAATAKGVDNDFEYRAVAADGRIVWLRDLVRVVRDTKGQVCQLRGVMVDITERKRAEEALRESEASLAEAQRMSHVGSWDWDVEKNQSFCSDEHYRIFGVPLGQSDWSFDKFLNCVHPEDRQRVKKAHGAALAGEKPYNTEYRIIRPDGSERIVSAQGEVSVDEAGQPTRIVGTVHDITERKQAEEALRRSEAEYRSLIQGAAYGIYRFTAEGKFLDVNPALMAMLGYDSETELLAANLSTEIYRDPGARARVVAQYLERWDSLEVEWKRKDGAPITVRLSGRAVRDVDGTLAYFEGIAENVTEQRLLEAQLQQAQKMEAVGRLAGGVAHDFNNLLMVMRGYTELLLGRLGANDPLRRNVEEIQKAADRATSLTQQLLAFSRKQVMQPKVFDLNAVVSDTERMLRRLIGEDIELATILGPELGRVKADPGQIEQVILNLAVNARDAMPQGGPNWCLRPPTWS